MKNNKTLPIIASLVTVAAAGLAAFSVFTHIKKSKPVMVDEDYCGDDYADVDFGDEELGVTGCCTDEFEEPFFCTSCCDDECDTLSCFESDDCDSDASSAIVTAAVSSAQPVEPKAAVKPVEPKAAVKPVEPKVEIKSEYKVKDVADLLGLSATQVYALEDRFFIPTIDTDSPKRYSHDAFLLFKAIQHKRFVEHKPYAQIQEEIKIK